MAKPFTFIKWGLKGAKPLYIYKMGFKRGKAPLHL